MDNKGSEKDYKELLSSLEKSLEESLNNCLKNMDNPEATEEMKEAGVNYLKSLVSMIESLDVHSEVLDSIKNLANNYINNGGRQKVNIKTKTGESKEAEIISVVEIDGKNYVVYAIRNEKGLHDIMASYLVKNAKGYDEFYEIKDSIDLEKIRRYIKELFS